ncbi:MAG: DUF2845 domain-containing protein [Nitrospirae bacterium]|nr:DUF2845 domain-containing protein [Nitrospirota bacterium]
MNILYVLTLLPCLLLPVFAGNAFALRCGSSLVETGDRKFEVLRTCGKPLFIEKSTDQTAIISVDGKNDKSDVDISYISTANVEEWTYNFGPQKFIAFLTFVDGKLTRIEDGPKGFKGEFPDNDHRSRCDSLVSEGDRKVEILIKCGKPDFIESFGEERVTIILEKLKIEGAFRRQDLLVNVEEWTYNLGPRKFLLFLRLENGRVVRKERGDYGY